MPSADAPCASPTCRGEAAPNPSGDCTCYEEALLLQAALDNPSSSQSLLATAMRQGGAHEAALMVEEEAAGTSDESGAGIAGAIDFAARFCMPIHEGRKRATTRKLATEPDLASIGAGDVVRAVCAERSGGCFAMLQVTAVEDRTVGAIDAQLAAVEGFDSAADLRAALAGFYPGLNDDDEVRVIHFVKSTTRFRAAASTQ